MQFKNDFSREVWTQTYKHHEDADATAMWSRVATDISSIEADKNLWRDRFLSVLNDFAFVPGGRILSNAGTGWKTSYINCFVKPRSSKVDMDSLDGIMSILRDQAQTLKSEGGWGCNFSFIRPRGSFINGIGVESPGSVKYMELFDKSSEIITAGSGKKSTNKKAKGKIRKGAMMGILEVWHPDIEEFITSKVGGDKLTKFNLSVGALNSFMDKVIEIENINNCLKTYPETAEICQGQLDKVDKWDLVFPDTTFEKYHAEWYGDLEDWVNKDYPVNIYKTIKVSYLWNLIMESTYNRNDPGVAFLDRANKTHCWNYGPRKISRILECNPCGEQYLPDAGCCNLGSINLTQCIDVVSGSIDFIELERIVRCAVRFLDNVNSISYSPLPEYKISMEKLRRIGLGVMGWGSTLYLMKIRYASDKAEALKEKIMQCITWNGIDESINLAIEKGMFEFCDPEQHANHEYFKQIGLPQSILDRMRKHGIRNSSLFSIQPTGGTGVLANNVSGGLEPVWPEYIRTVICPHPPEHIKALCPKYWEGEFKENDMFKMSKEGSDDILIGKDANGTVYKIDKSRGLTVEVACYDYAVKILKENGEWDANADWAVSATQLTAEEHIRDMSGFSKFMDAAISKTINLSNDYPFDKFKNIYLDCYKTGYIKGFTTYRAGTMASVLKGVDEVAVDKCKFVKRPKELDCDVFHCRVRGEEYFCLVGLDDCGNPYEVFAGKNGVISKTVTSGTIYKQKKGHYQLYGGEKMILDNINSFLTEDGEALTRMTSMSLRHCPYSDLQYIADQLLKVGGDFTNLSKVIARCLKSYIRDGTTSNDECPNCGQKTLVYTEGCKTCKSCGFSAC